MDSASSNTLGDRLVCRVQTETKGTSLLTPEDLHFQPAVEMSASMEIAAREAALKFTVKF